MEIEFPRSPANNRPMGRLLEEISWDGGACKRLRNAERGKENMLTTEVFQALDLLPRQAFLGQVLGVRAKPALVSLINASVEDLEIVVLPGNVYLRPSEATHSQALGVQPDVLLHCDSVYAYVEAKAIRGKPAFQAEQLARQLLALHAYADGREAFMVLVIADPPPIKVKGRGSEDILTAITRDMDQVLDQSEFKLPEGFSTEGFVEERLVWITWSEIASTLTAQIKLTVSDPEIPESIGRAIQRGARHAIEAIEWHARSD